MSWTAVGVLCGICYLQKLAGMVVPPRVLAAHPTLARLSGRLPAALLAALVVTGAIATGARLVPDARLVGMAVAVGLLAVRAPLVVVVVAAAAGTAVARSVG